MRSFLDENFLLRSDTARRLYFEHAATQPIYDYHSHLDPAAIARDRHYDNLTELWLDGDHYKWRAMRAAGVPERLITGDAADYEKFAAFATILPQCIGNPLYHWTHMELKFPLGLPDVLLSAATAERVWRLSREQLAPASMSTRGLLAAFDVRMIGTTDDAIDSLDAHAAIAADRSLDIAVLPTWRPDLLFKPEHDDFLNWIGALGQSAGIEIRDYGDLLDALIRRLQHFARHGCVSADHGFDRFEFHGPTDAATAEALFARRLRNQPLSATERVAWRSGMATWLGHQYAERGWVMQLHIGALRNNNSRMLERIGPNSGFDSIGDGGYAEPLARFLDTLDREGALPRTILYGLNPRDYEMLATMAGNFPGNGQAAKVQLGSAWWFNDQKDGILRQLTSVANMGLLARFIGMLTDSRSFLSFSRHEYFRRILCDLIGGWVEAGEAPADEELLGSIVRDIGSRNTVACFGLHAAEPG